MSAAVHGYGAGHPYGTYSVRVQRVRVRYVPVRTPNNAIYGSTAHVCVWYVADPVRACWVRNMMATMSSRHLYYPAPSSYAKTAGGPPCRPVSAAVKVRTRPPPPPRKKLMLACCVGVGASSRSGSCTGLTSTDVLRPCLRPALVRAEHAAQPARLRVLCLSIDAGVLFLINCRPRRGCSVIRHAPRHRL